MKYLCCVILLATSVAGRYSNAIYRNILNAHEEKNIITSTFSVEMILSMLSLGAVGETGEDLRIVLNLPENKQAAAEQYRSLLTNLQRREQVAILDLANRIYINDKYSIVPQFNVAARYGFQAEAQAISVKSPETAASIVNKWVNDQTRGRIKDIVTSDDMNSNLIAVLLSAIYFKGQWQYQFEEKDTKLETFRLSDGRNTTVPMMSLYGTFRTASLRQYNAKMIELPYRNSSLSMRIYLPDKVDDLRFVETASIGTFDRILVEENVRVKLPRFKIEFQVELKEILKQKKMGISRIFEFSDDFRGLVSGPQLRIEKVLQKAFIEVNEQGAEAAAATVVTVGNRCLNCGATFIADHPFAFDIRDANTIYFQGHVQNPNGK